MFLNLFARFVVVSIQWYLLFLGLVDHIMAVINSIFGVFITLYISLLSSKIQRTKI